MVPQGISTPRAPEHDDEPVPGLPENLPEGERILWQGRPSWPVLARRAFHVRGLAIYFAVLLVWRAVTVLSVGGSALHASVAVLWLLPLAVAALGLLSLMAWMSSKTTVYTITNRRVVMRIGVVLTVTFNFPFRCIDAAGLRPYADGTGDIALTLNAAEKVAFLHLWPHARPWRLARPVPMLRALPEATRVAQILSGALAASVGEFARRSLAPPPVRQPRAARQRGALAAINPS